MSKMQKTEIKSDKNIQTSYKLFERWRCKKGPSGLLTSLYRSSYQVITTVDRFFPRLAIVFKIVGCYFCGFIVFPSYSL